MAKEHDLDWQSSADRLAAVMEPFYKGRNQLLDGIKCLESNTKHIDTTTKLGNGLYTRAIKSTRGYIRLLLTRDAKTYPGEYYAAPESLVEGYVINYEKDHEQLTIKDIAEVDLDSTRNTHFGEHKYKPSKSFKDGVIDPFEATLVWLPKLSKFFRK